jgi:hypothetical protein
MCGQWLAADFHVFGATVRTRFRATNRRVLEAFEAGITDADRSFFANAKLAHLQVALNALPLK